MCCNLLKLKQKNHSKNDLSNWNSESKGSLITIEV